MLKINKYWMHSTPHQTFIQNSKMHKINSSGKSSFTILSFFSLQVCKLKVLLDVCNWWLKVHQRGFMNEYTIIYSKNSFNVSFANSAILRALLLHFVDIMHVVVPIISSFSVFGELCHVLLFSMPWGWN